MFCFSDLESHLPAIEKKLAYTFKNPKLLLLAFVHRSYVNENKDQIKEHNERLEFLGDSVLNLLMAEYLYNLYPNKPEGYLSSLRALLVDGCSCEIYLNQLEVEPYLLMGKGEQENLGKARKALLANLFEALLGAIFLDGGIQPVKTFLFKTFSSRIDQLLKNPPRNYKAEFQDYTQKKNQQTPVYTVIEQSGPDHQKTFYIKVEVDGVIWGKGIGQSKKEAQQLAAKEAMEKVK